MCRHPLRRVEHFRRYLRTGPNLVPPDLKLIELTVLAAPGHQIAMPSAVNDPALPQNQDEVCLGGRQEVMSDPKAWSPSHESVQGLSDPPFPLRMGARHRLGEAPE